MLHSALHPHGVCALGALVCIRCDIDILYCTNSFVNNVMKDLVGKLQEHTPHAHAANCATLKPRHVVTKPTLLWVPECRYPTHTSLFTRAICIELNET